MTADQSRSNPIAAYLSTAYFPPIDYFIAIANSVDVILEAEESYQKQSYRNRCNVYAANGVLSLSVPIRKGDTISISGVEIDYSKSWLRQHKRALVSAYSSSPFFEHYQDEIFEILDRGEPSLFTLNYLLISKILEIIGLDNNLMISTVYLSKLDDNSLDYRGSIHPKNSSPILYDKSTKIKPYYQVFSNKQGFKSNLSILDLIFNEGPNSISFLVF